MARLATTLSEDDFKQGFGTIGKGEFFEENELDNIKQFMDTYGVEIIDVNKMELDEMEETGEDEYGLDESENHRLAFSLTLKINKETGRGVVENPQNIKVGLDEDAMEELLEDYEENGDKESLLYDFLYGMLELNYAELRQDDDFYYIEMDSI